MKFSSLFLALILTSQLLADFTSTPAGPYEIEVGFGQSNELALTVTNAGSEAADPDLVFREGVARELSDARERLDTKSPEILGLLADRFSFNEGETGNSIGDGGNDMYDGGNRLRFGPLDTPVLDYSNDGIATNNSAGVSYFTRKYDGLFVLIADYGSNDSFDISGDLGADGGGNVVLSEFDAGSGYYAFVKSVVNAGDPSVNHLILAPSDPGLSRTAPTSTNSDDHTVSGLPADGRLIYLLFAKPSGQSFSSQAIESLAEEIAATFRSGPPWLSWNDDLTIPSGQSIDFQLQLSSEGLAPGTYETDFVIAAKDSNPATIPPGDFDTLSFTVAEPTFTTETNSREIGAILGAPLDPVRFELNPITGNLDDLVIETNAAWLNVTRVPGENAILISPDSVGNTSAEIVLTSGGTRQIIELKFLVAPLDLIHLLPDPNRPVLYAINQSGKGQGSVIVIDTLTQTIIKSIPVGLEPTDLALTEESSDLLVMNTSDPSIQRINLTSLEITETYELQEFSNRNDDVGGHLADGPGDVIYYVDEQWGPRLRVFDTSTETVLQTFGSESDNSNNTSNDNGFGDFLVSRDKTRIYGWKQYGDGAGSSGTGVVRFDIAPDGTLSNFFNGPASNSENFTREPFDTPVLLTRNEDRLIIKDAWIDPETLQVIQRYPDEIYSVTPNGAVTASIAAFYPSYGGEELENFGGPYPVQTILPDYSYFVYFNSGQINWLDLVNQLGTDQLAINLNPTPDSTVTSPESINWLPTTGISTYDFYLGTEQASVASANQSSPEFQTSIHGETYQIPSPLAPGIYYWKASPEGTNSGTVYSFTVSQIELSESAITLRTLAGIESIPGTIDITSANTGVTWSVSSPDSWIEFDSNTGTTPSTLNYSINTTELTAGRMASTITITFDSTSLNIPVNLTVDEANFIQANGDREEPFVYLISQMADDGTTPAYLVELDTRSDTLTRAVSCGKSATDLAIHYQENRIYVPNFRTGILRAFDRTSLEQVQTYQYSAGGGFTQNGTTVSGVSAGANGRLVISESNQWVTVSYIDTSNGTTLGTGGAYGDGRGEHSPDGRFYYHPDRGISNGSIRKYELGGPDLTAIATFQDGSNRGDTLVSGDGNRVFWGRYVLDSDLNQLRQFDENIVSISYFGDIAMTESSVINANNGQNLATLPVATDVQAVSLDQSKLYLMEGGAVTVVDLSAITALPPIAIQPSIPDNGTVFGADQEISWSAVSSAITYDIFLGTNRDSVANAGRNDPEFVANNEVNFLFEGFTGLTLGQTYFWKILPIGINGPGEPSMWSFQVSPSSVTPREVHLAHPDKAPLPPVTIQISGPSTWTAEENFSWISLDKDSGAPDDQLTVSFDLSDLTPSDDHEASITITTDGVSTELPIHLNLLPLNFVLAEGDVLRPVVYAITQPDNDPEAPSFLLTIDTESDEITKATPCGHSVDDLAVHYQENRLYLISSTENIIRVFDRETLEEVRTIDEITVPNPDTPGENFSIEIVADQIVPGPAGQIIVEANSFTDSIQRLDSQTGQRIESIRTSEGGGGYAPGFQNYYFGQSGNSGAQITTYLTDTDSFTLDKNYRDEEFNYYGSRNLRVSGDGSLISWGGSLFDPALNFISNYGDVNPPGTTRRGEVRALSYFGDVASYDGGVVRVSDGSILGTYPAVSTVQAISNGQDKIYLFEGGEFTIFDLASVIDLPNLQLIPDIPDGAVVFEKEQDLSWSPIPSATAYQIYFGTNETAVSDATPNSPEFLEEANTAMTSEALAGLEPGQNYYWRVDYLSPGGVVGGDVFQFQVAPFSISPPVIEIEFPAGAPVPAQTISLSSDNEVQWSAMPSADVTLSHESGTTDGTLSIDLDTSDLTPGDHRRSITFSVGDSSFDYEIKLTVHPNQVVRMKPGITDNTVLALTSQTPSQGPSFLIEINASTGDITRFFDAGFSPLDFDFATGSSIVHLLSPDSEPSLVVDLENNSYLPSRTYSPVASSIQVMPDGRTIIGQAERSRNIDLYEPGSTTPAFSQSFYTFVGEINRPMTLSADGSILYTLSDFGNATSYSIGANEFVQLESLNSMRYDTRLPSDILVTETSGEIFFRNTRTTPLMEERLRLAEDFQPIAVDHEGRILVGTDQIFFARSGEPIADLDYSSTQAAISRDGAALVRANPATGYFDTIAFSDLFAAPGPLPQPSEEIYDPVTEISIPPISGATSYELFWGRSAADLTLAGTSETPVFDPGENLPSYSKVFWRIDSLTGGTRNQGTVYQFSILPKRTSAAISGSLGNLHIAEGVLTAGSGGSFQTGYVKSHDLSAPLPEQWFNAITLSQEGNQSPRNVLGQSYASGRVFTNRHNSIVGFERTRTGSLLEVDSLSLGDFSTRRIDALTGSGDLLFAGVTEVRNPSSITVVDVYRTFPNLELEQTLTKPSSDSSISGFGRTVVAGENLLVVSNAEASVFGSVHLWIYRRGSSPSNPWFLIDRVNFNRDSASTARIDTDGKLIAVYYRESNTGAERISVLSEVSHNNFSVTWSSLARDLLEEEIVGSFVQDIAIDQDHLAISARRTNPRLDHPNSTLVLERQENDWIPQTPLSASPYTEFGTSIEISSGRVYVSDSQYFHQFTISPDTNQYPRFDSPAPFQAVAGQPYQAVIEISDDSDSVAVSGEQLPSWLSIDQLDGKYRLSGTAPNSTSSQDTIRLKATDNEGLSTYRTFNLSRVAADSTPVLTMLPVSESLGAGQELSLKPKTSGVGPFTWQWFFNGSPIVGATFPTFGIANVTDDDEGTYRLVVTNIVGSIESNEFSLQVTPAGRSAGNWPTFGAGPRRLGHHPAKLGSHNFRPLWTVETHPGIQLQRTAIADGRVFVIPQTRFGGPQPVKALDLETGSELWSRTFDEANSYNPPTYHDGRVYFQRGNHSNDSQLWALDAATGQTIWSTPYSDQWSSFEAPAVTGEGIWVGGGYYGGLYGYNNDGSEKFFEAFSDGNQWAPTVANGVVYTYASGALTVRDHENGARLWSLDALDPNQPNRGISGTPVVTPTDAVVLLDSNTVACVDLESRSTKWLTSPSITGLPFNTPLLGTPAVYADGVFVFSRRAIVCLDLETGEEKYTLDMGDPGNGSSDFLISDQPLLLNDYLFAASRAETFIFDLEKQELVQTLPVGGRLSYSNGYLTIADQGTLHTYFANDIPDIGLAALPEMIEDQAYSVDLNITHLDDDEPLTMTLRNAPDFISLSETGVLSGIFETNVATTEYTLEVEVSDDVNDPVSRQYTLNLINVNDPPRLTSFAVDMEEDSAPFTIPLAQVVSDEETPLEELIVLLSDFAPRPEGPVVTYAIENGMIIITPVLDQFADFEVLLSAQDSDELKSDLRVPASVTPVPDPPRIGTAILAQATDEAGSDLAISLNQAFIDPDPGEELTITITGNTSPQLFSNIGIDGNTLQIQFAPYVSGSSEVTVTATDPGGLKVNQTFAVSLPDLSPPGVTPAGVITLNRRTGFYEQKVTITNSAARAIGGFDLFVNDLTNGYSVNGWPGNSITHREPIEAGQSVTLTLEYHSPTSRELPTPGFNATTALPVDALPVIPSNWNPDRIIPMPDRTMLLEFGSVPGKRYQIQYSHDMETWLNSPVIITAGANRTQWIDQGLPKTNCHPKDCNMRFYRIVEVTDQTTD